MKRRLLKASLMLTLLVTYFYTCAITSIPQNIVIIEGEKLNLKMAKGLSLISKNQSFVKNTEQHIWLRHRTRDNKICKNVISFAGKICREMAFFYGRVYNSGEINNKSRLELNIE